MDSTWSRWGGHWAGPLGVCNSPRRAQQPAAAGSRQQQAAGSSRQEERAGRQEEGGEGRKEGAASALFKTSTQPQEGWEKLRKIAKRVFKQLS